MRYAMIGALAVLAAAPLSAQSGQFRTGDIGSVDRRLPTDVRLPGQEQKRESGENRKSDKIPRGHLPPEGMCRIWVDGVPPGQQPAPTDCQTAVATKPANARVIWGDQAAFPGRANGKFSKHGSDKQKNKVKQTGDDDIFGIDRTEDRSRRKSVAKRGKKG